MLCTTCASIDLAKYFQEEVDLLHDDMYLGAANNEAVRLGSLREIYDKKDVCRFCHLVLASLWYYQGNPYSPEACLELAYKRNVGKQCYIYSYLSANNGGTIYDTGDANETRSASQKAYRIGIGLRSPQGSYFATLDHSGDIQLLGTSAAMIGKSNLFFGRAIDADRVNVKLARSWLSLCESAHGQKCETPAVDPDEASQCPFPVDLLVIDVSLMCLAKPASEVRYIALSYCWPQNTTSNFLTTRSILSSLFLPGSLEAHMDKFSPVIQDAISFVREFGEQFLWIDALCIVQDDESQKYTQIGQMDLVYGAAALTIICAPFETTNMVSQGLPGYRSGSRACPQTIEEVQSLSLATSFSDSDTVVFRSRWRTRAWTFQEEILSRRKLYFTKSQLYFQCSCAVFCEDAIGEGCEPTAFIHCHTSLWNACGIDAPQLQGQDSLTTWVSRSPPSNSIEKMYTYTRLLDHYTRRNMSYPGDIVFAFQGLLTVFKRTMRTEFLAGLPETYFHESLLWLPTSPHRRREVSVGSSIIMPYPSWSWAGWLTHVRYDGLFDGLILPEVEWFLIDQDGSAVKLNTAAAYNPPLSPLGQQNTDVRPGEAPPDFLEKIKPREHITVTDGYWDDSHILATWTTIARFTLKGEYFRPKCLDGDFGTDFESFENMIIFDKDGNSAGSILLDNDLMKDLLETGKAFEFMLLSRSAELSGMKFFDAGVFCERKWCYINVMLIWRSEGYATRLGIGAIHEDAWVQAEPTPTLVKLR